MFRTWKRTFGVFIVAIIAVYTAADAQHDVWTANTENRAAIVKDKAVARSSFPTDFKLFNLDINELRPQLFSVVDDAARMRSAVISLPNADGNIEQFEVYEDSNFEPDLQAQFPQIRAFSGKGITDPYATLKLSISPQGIQTMVFRSDLDNEFMEPYSADHNTYAVYKASRDRGSLPWACATEDRGMVTDLKSKIPSADRPESNAGQVKTVRLAQSCNGEYANFFNAHSAADVALVLAAFNATIARVNGVNEKDLAIHFNLIAATTAVIYYDPATDPYTTLSSWNAQEQAVMTANIGEANYDIGHMFGASGGGGNAGCIGCVCVDGSKGSGITSPADNIPMGDNFDIDYVVHEMGHQLGANHSFTFSSESGSPVQMEVGSGITIMGYAGITSQDVAPHSIDTFHAGNIGQIQTNLAGKTCPITTVMTVNHPPVVSPVTAATIPISTPFALTGSATDPESDPITYQWEEIDNTNTLTGNSSVASPTKASGPNWLSFVPTTSPTRFFPRLSTVQAGLAVTPVLPGGDAIANIEALSSISRTLNFRLTVRDNNPYVAGVKTGQTASTDVAVTVTAAAGPFKVTSPNTNVSWAGLSSHTITWDVAGTTANGVNVANVKISISTDGGNTFSTLLASTPNNGSANVSIPNTATSSARIKVEAIGNIFYDMSDANFTIAAPIRPAFDFDGDGKSDFAVTRNVGGTINWYLQQSTAGFRGALWGSAGDVFVPGDYDGDAKWDLAVWRSGSFYILNSSTNTLNSALWGQAGDDPSITQDFDGDGKADPAVTRNVSGVLTYYMLRSTSGFAAVSFGNATTDVPIRGDFDGDGKADVAAYRTTGAQYNTFRVLQSSNSATVTRDFGFPGTDYAVTGDFDGDGKADYAVWRGKTGAGDGGWNWVRSIDGVPASAGFGVAGSDLPVPGDYDGDGKTDQAVWRPSTGVFYANRSTAGFTAFSFGLNGDVPPAFSLQAK